LWCKVLQKFPIAYTKINKNVKAGVNEGEFRKRNDLDKQAIQEGEY